MTRKSTQEKLPDCVVPDHGVCTCAQVYSCEKCKVYKDVKRDYLQAYRVLRKAISALQKSLSKANVR